MKNNPISPIIEGLLFATGDDGITVNQLSKVLDLSKTEIITGLEELIEQYEYEERGMMILQDQAVYSMSTRPEHKAYYQKFFSTPQATKLTQASLETLAIIAYKQPITRTEIEGIRGVKSERSLQTLLSRSLIEELGRKDAIGRPVLFGTSRDFLLFFGLTSLKELPELMEDLIGEQKENQEIDLFT